MLPSGDDPARLAVNTDARALEVDHRVIASPEGSAVPVLAQLGMVNLPVVFEGAYGRSGVRRSGDVELRVTTDQLSNFGRKTFGARRLNHQAELG
jgi:hypothetical protein